MKQHAGVFAAVLSVFTTCVAAITAFGDLDRFSATERAVIFIVAVVLSYTAVGYWCFTSDASRPLRAGGAIGAFAVLMAVACTLYVVDLMYRHVVVTHTWVNGRGDVVLRAPRKAADIRFELAVAPPGTVRISSIEPRAGSGSQNPKLAVVNSAGVAIWSFRTPQAVTLVYRSGAPASHTSTSPSPLVAFIDSGDLTRRQNFAVTLGITTWIIASAAVWLFLSHLPSKEKSRAGFATPGKSSTR